MRICRAEAFLIRLPLRLSVRHALASRRESLNLFVRLCDDQGNEGWGEGVPRDYVTGESAETSFAHLAEVLLPSLVGTAVEDPDQVLPAVARLLTPSPGNQTCCCAAELALLDLAGKAVQPIGGVVVRRAAAGVGPVLRGPPAARTRRDDGVPRRRAASRRVSSQDQGRGAIAGRRPLPRPARCWGSA